MMEPGMEWLTKRPLNLERVAETVPLDEELLNEEAIGKLRSQAEKKQ